jgi:hypothetical protein
MGCSQKRLQDHAAAHPAVIRHHIREGNVMNKTDNKQPKKLSLSRETVRILSNVEGTTAKPEDTSPRCTEYGPRCEF